MIHISNLQNILTSNAIVLWVEDRLTREYLSKIWQPEDKSFNILIGGGRNVIKGIVHSLRKEGLDYVFGLIDRDFDQSNYSKWTNPASPIEIFRPTHLEIENFLLSWEAMAGCNGNRCNRKTHEIMLRAKKRAQGMIWWMALRSVLSSYGDMIVGNFPQHPAVDRIRAKSDAESYIKSSDWYAQFPSHAHDVADPVTLTKKLHDAYACHHDQIASGEWCKHFSGKEIFQYLRGYLFNASYASQEEMNVDLAKSIADWQIENNTLPQELIELKDALKSRVGL